MGKQRYTLMPTFFMISLGILATPISALANSCQFQFDKQADSASLFVNNSQNKPQAFYIRRISDTRYGDTQEVYNAINCQKVTSGSADKSNFTTVMANNHFTRLYIDTTSPQAQYTNDIFSLYVTSQLSNGKLILSTYPLNATQKRSINTLKAYADTKQTHLSQENLQQLQTDSILQKLLNLPNNQAAEKYKFAYLIAKQDFATAKQFYQQKSLNKTLAADTPLLAKYTALTVQKGNFDDVYPFAEKGDNQALASAMQKANTDEQYRQAELLLVKQIKDQLFTYSANITGGDVKTETWQEARLFGRTTDEGQVTATNTVAYRSKLNTALYNPKNTFTVKAKLVITVNYNGNLSKDYETELTTQLGGGKTNATGNTNIQWMTARAGAGSFMQQNYTYKDYAFKITDISVE